jgi:hypothetical protein
MAGDVGVALDLTVVVLGLTISFFPSWFSRGRVVPARTLASRFRRSSTDFPSTITTIPPRKILNYLNLLFWLLSLDVVLLLDVVLVLFFVCCSCSAVVSVGICFLSKQ